MCLSVNADVKESAHPASASLWFWLIVGLVVMAILRIAWMLPERARQNDFAHYYLSSRLLVEGHDPYRTPLKPLYESYGFVFDARIPNGTNPPPLLWLVVPFSLLPPAAAHWLWSAFNGVCLAACLAMIRRMVCADWSQRSWWAAILAVLISYPIVDHFVFSQVQLELAGLLLGAFGLQRSGRPRAACVLAAIAAALKLFPVLMLPWFVFSAATGFREMLRRTAIVAITGSLIVTATGLTFWQGFAERGLPVISMGTMNQWGNQSLPSLVLNIASTIQGLELNRDSNRFWWTAASAAGAVTLIASYLAVWVTNAEPRVKFGLLLLAMVISGATAWTHYLVFLIWPAVVVVDLAFTRPSPVRQIATGLMAILLVFPIGVYLNSALLERPILITVLLNYFPLLGILLAMGLLLASFTSRNSSDRQERRLCAAQEG